MTGTLGQCTHLLPQYNQLLNGSEQDCDVANVGRTQASTASLSRLPGKADFVAARSECPAWLQAREFNISRRWFTTVSAGQVTSLRQEAAAYLKAPLDRTQLLHKGVVLSDGTTIAQLQSGGSTLSASASTLSVQLRIKQDGCCFDPSLQQYSLADKVARACSRHQSLHGIFAAGPHVIFEPEQILNRILMQADNSNKLIDTFSQHVLSGRDGPKAGS